MTPLFPRRAHYFAIWMLLAAFAIYGSLWPLTFESVSFATACERFLKVLTHPPRRISQSDLATNVLLMVPTSFAAMGALLADKKYGRTWLAAIIVAAVNTLLSIAVEFLQQWAPLRVSSVFDIGAQILGTGIGIGLWIGAGRSVTRWLRFLFADLTPRSPLERLLQIYIGGLVICSWLPFDLTIHPNELRRKLRAGLIQFIPFAHQDWSFTSVALLGWILVMFIPVGVWAIIYTSRSRLCGRPLPSALLIAVPFAVLLECSQLFVASRLADTTHIILGIAGVLIGITIGSRFKISDPRSA